MKNISQSTLGEDLEITNHFVHGLTSWDTQKGRFCITVFSHTQATHCIRLCRHETVAALGETQPTVGHQPRRRHPVSNVVTGDVTRCVFIVIGGHCAQPLSLGRRVAKASSSSTFSVDSSQKKVECTFTATGGQMLCPLPFEGCFGLLVSARFSRAPCDESRQLACLA